MSEIKIVNATGLACPQPVMLAKQAIESNEQVRVIVDNDTALENVKRLGTKLGCEVKVEKNNNGNYEIDLTLKAGAAQADKEFVPSCSIPQAASSGPFVIVFATNKMGQGSDELGYVLIRAFLHTVCLEKKKPDAMIFYNAGVKLTIEGSEVLDDLKELAASGVEILVCGTCLNYFEVKEKLAVGIVSNMYDIVSTMSKAGRLLTP